MSRCFRRQATAGGQGGRGEKHCRRAIVDALAYAVRGGIAWAMIPAESPPYQTASDT
ncbi:transposase [Nocardia sp. CA-135953]|uniref:transposase n=1 Tax=Nocardia sp. CA-135953 TaxID=3239978 RepID=UPI003D95A1E6